MEDNGDEESGVLGSTKKKSGKNPTSTAKKHNRKFSVDSNEARKLHLSCRELSIIASHTHTWICRTIYDETVDAIIGRIRVLAYVPSSVVWVS
ncbi:hypothetical protein ACTXT7_007188 [Hymenolepis weldensis]